MVYYYCTNLHVCTYSDVSTAPSFEAPSHEANLLGRRGIAFIASNCHTHSGRTDYIEILMRHTKVNSYGACLHNTDWPDNLENTARQSSDYSFGKIQVMKNYTFTVVISNSICDGYVDEKLDDAYNAGTIPIVLGSPTVHLYDFNLALGLEHPSMILIENFPSPKALAEFLEELDGDEDSLSLYHQFRNIKLRAKREGTKFIVPLKGTKEFESNPHEPECFACMKASELKRTSSSSLHEARPLRCHGHWSNRLREMSWTTQTEEAIGLLQETRERLRISQVDHKNSYNHRLELLTTKVRVLLDVCWSDLKMITESTEYTPQSLSKKWRSHNIECGLQMAKLLHRQSQSINPYQSRFPESDIDKQSSLPLSLWEHTTQLWSYLWSGPFSTQESASTVSETNIGSCSIWETPEAEPAPPAGDWGGSDQPNHERWCVVKFQDGKTFKALDKIKIHYHGDHQPTCQAFMDVRFANGMMSMGHALNVIQSKSQVMEVPQDAGEVAYMLIRYNATACPQTILSFTFSVSKLISAPTKLYAADINKRHNSATSTILPNKNAKHIDVFKWDVIQDPVFWFSKNRSDAPGGHDQLIQSRFYQWLHSLLFARWVVKNTGSLSTKVDTQKLDDQNIQFKMPHRGWLVPQQRVKVTESLLMQSKTLPKKPVSVYTQLDIK